MNLSHITSKFPHYRSLEALQEEAIRTKPFMEQIVVALRDDIAMVQAAGWTFNIFWIRDQERILHCGLYHCCREESGPNELRKELESKIYDALPFDKIVWEI